MEFDLDYDNGMEAPVSEKKRTKSMVKSDLGVSTLIGVSIVSSSQPMF